MENNRCPLGYHNCQTTLTYAVTPFIWSDKISITIQVIGRALGHQLMSHTMFSLHLPFAEEAHLPSVII